MAMAVAIETENKFLSAASEEQLFQSKAPSGTAVAAAKSKTA